MKLHCCHSDLYPLWLNTCIHSHIQGEGENERKSEWMTERRVKTAYRETDTLKPRQAWTGFFSTLKMFSEKKHSEVINHRYHTCMRFVRFKSFHEFLLQNGINFSVSVWVAMLCAMSPECYFLSMCFCLFYSHVPLFWFWALSPPLPSHWCVTPITPICSVFSFWLVCLFIPSCVFISSWSPIDCQ